jgi:hypothetical protein
MNHATRLPRFFALLTALTLLAPPRAQAAPAEDPQALVVFEAGFKDGQAKFDAGQFLEAARTWIAAANNLGEKLSNRDNRVAVYEYVADAFTSGLQGVEQPEALREAALALDAYCEGFTRAYGTETPISAKITGARDDFKARLAKAEAAQAAAPVEGPEPGPVVAEPPPVRDESGAKPWKGLVIAGGVLTGLGAVTGVVAAGYGAQGKKLEGQYLDADCRTMSSTECSDLKTSGETSNTKALRSAISAAPLLVVGVALLVVGLKRRSSARTAVAPALAPGFVGVGVRRAF